MSGIHIYPLMELFTPSVMISGFIKYTFEAGSHNINTEL